MSKTKRRGLIDDSETAAIHETYSNHVASVWRADDIRLVFGQYVPAKGDPFAPKGPAQGVLQPQEVRNSVEQRVAVTMSWAHAKLIHELLGAGIRRFEELNGEIKQNVAPSP